MAEDTTTPTIQEADLDEFCQKMTELPHPVRIAVGLMYHCGLRVGETAKLAWGDLIYLHLPLNEVRLTAPMCKNHHARTVPINGRLASMIADCWEEHARPQNIVPSSYATAKTRQTGPTSPRTLQRTVKAIGQAMHYPKLTPHVLRHTFATRLLTVSNLITVQQALGHRRVTTTQRYAHPTSEEMRTAMEKMS